MINYLRTFTETLSHPVNRGKNLLTIWRIIYWKLNQLTLKLPTIVNLGNNIKCVCYPDSSYGGMVVYTTYPDYEVAMGIKKNLREGGIFVDVGANIGFMSLVAATVRKSKIHSFEPSPIAYPRLVENINLNNLGSRVKLNNSLISNSNKSISFVEDDRSELSHISKSDEKGIKIKSSTLDAYCSKNKIKKIDVLKIDVEGAELSVLKGAGLMLQTHKIKHIYVELNYACRQYGSTNSESLSYLKSLGYRHSKIPSDIDNKVFNLHAWTNR